MTLLQQDDQDEGRVQVWRCIGCGRIESPQQCIGVCQDRRVELVEAAVHARVLAERDALRAQVAGLQALARTIALTTPRPGGCEQTWQALQQTARALLGQAG